MSFMEIAQEELGLVLIAQDPNKYALTMILFLICLSTGYVSFYLPFFVFYVVILGFFAHYSSRPVNTNWLFCKCFLMAVEQAVKQSKDDSFTELSHSCGCINAIKEEGFCTVEPAFPINPSSNTPERSTSVHCIMKFMEIAQEELDLIAQDPNKYALTMILFLICLLTGYITFYLMFIGFLLVISCFWVHYTSRLAEKNRVYCKCYIRGLKQGAKQSKDATCWKLSQSCYCYNAEEEKAFWSHVKRHMVPVFKPSSIES